MKKLSDRLLVFPLVESTTLYSSGSQTSHHVPFVGPILSLRTTLLQENSIYQIYYSIKSLEN